MKIPKEILSRLVLRLWAWIFGVKFVVVYLRNPNPRRSVELMKWFGAKIGRKTKFKRTVFLDNVYEDQNSSSDLSKMSIGENCYIGDGVYLDLANRICLQENVVVSGLVSFVTHADCNRSPILSEHFPRKDGDIVIEEGAWIGFRATILCGCRIGRNSVVAAGSVVNKDVEPFTVVGGIPAKPIGKINSHS